DHRPICPAFHSSGTDGDDEGLVAVPPAHRGPRGTGSNPDPNRQAARTHATSTSYRGYHGGAPTRTSSPGTPQRSDPGTVRAGAVWPPAKSPPSTGRTGRYRPQ